MEAFHLEFSLCLNGLAVPLEHKEMQVLDPDSLSGAWGEAWGMELGSDDLLIEMSLLSLKATADMWWFLKPMKLGSKWWKTHHSEIPLLIEILSIIKSKKSKSRRVPKEPDAMVLLKVREKVLCVQNLPHLVTLGFPGAPEDNLPLMKQLMWILEQLSKDIKRLGENPVDPEEALVEAPEQSEEEDEASTSQKQIIQDCLKNLQKHPNCLSAIWAPSRTSFRIKRQDKRFRDFRVKALKRKKTPDHEEGQFQESLEEALLFLDGEDSAPGPAVPLADQASEEK